MNLVLKYWHTLRYLRPVQFYGRVWFRLKRPRPDLGDAPDLRVQNGEWGAPVAGPASMSGERDFIFLNKSGGVHKPTDWNDPARDKLWLYNLHYFDDLNAFNALDRQAWHAALIARWITDNPPGDGNGWEPYPLSLRIVNWIKWGLAGNELDPAWKHSLAVQTRFLRARLEWHLLGNHLFANAKALVFAGMFFAGEEADEWLEKGLAILSREIGEQILPDGGHFELSPMYHAIILEDMLDLINMARAYRECCPASVTKNWCSTAESMFDWLAVMCHPDGEISFFNDAAFSIAAPLKELQSYGERSGLRSGKSPLDGITHLENSGYIRVQKDQMVAILDVGRIGPDYIPGHAHADTLSFELSLDGRRVIVNSGISQYGAGRERLFQRSSKAHNTLEIDGESSSEVWSGFRVARRARPFDLDIQQKDGEIIIVCSHDGYQRLKGRVTHRREWRFNNRSFEIIDRISGQYSTAFARYHLHPDVKLSGGGEHGDVDLPDGQTLHWQLIGGTARVHQTKWYPEFGKATSNQCLNIEFSKSSGTLIFDW